MAARIEALIAEGHGSDGLTTPVEHGGRDAALRHVVLLDAGRVAAFPDLGQHAVQFVPFGDRVLGELLRQIMADPALRRPRRATRRSPG